jgi:probable rRNA maturation factor
MNTGNSRENTVEVRAESLEPPSWLSAVSEYAHRVLDRLEIAGWEVSILLCNTAFIQQLNRDYRGVDDPTDVLSFLSTDDGPDTQYRYAGDIVIAPEVVEEQARDLDVPFEEELRRVIVHGLLHLAGYEHTSNDFQLEPMLLLQEQIVEEVKEKLF